MTNTAATQILRNLTDEAVAQVWGGFLRPLRDSDGNLRSMTDDEQTFRNAAHAEYLRRFNH